MFNEGTFNSLGVAYGNRTGVLTVVVTVVFVVSRFSPTVDVVVVVVILDANFFFLARSTVVLCCCCCLRFCQYHTVTRISKWKLQAIVQTST